MQKEPPTSTAKPSRRGSGLLKYALHFAVLAGAIWAGVKYLDGAALQKAFHEFDWRYAPLVCGLGFLSVALKGWRFGTMLRRTNDISHATAMKAYVSGQSATLLPGGVAARAGLLEQVGVPVDRSSPAIALSSITDQIGFLGCSMVAALFFESARRPVGIMLAILAVLSVVLAIEAVRTWLVRFVERLLGRFNKAEQWRAFVRNLSETTDAKLLAYGVANTLMSFVLLVGALYLCTRGVGRDVPLATLFLAFVLPTMLGRISALPGGFGVTEVGMVGVLNAAPGVTLDEAAVATLVFRLGTVVFTAAAGGLVYLLAWRKVARKAETTGDKVDSKPAAGVA